MPNERTYVCFADREMRRQEPPLYRAVLCPVCGNEMYELSVNAPKEGDDRAWDALRSKHEGGRLRRRWNQFWSRVKR